MPHGPILACMPSHHAPHSAEHWDEIYSGDPVWSGRPNSSLLREVRDLAPGRALDVGCGEGADSAWLAEHGWRVTAVDISPTAVERTLAAVARAGFEAEGMAGDILDVALPASFFDLVSVMFPALPRSPEGTAEQRLLDLVAPGGTLLVVHHAEVDRGHALAHGCNPDDFISPLDVERAARERGGWRVVTHERRDEEPAAGADAPGVDSHHTGELVVRLERE